MLKTLQHLRTMFSRKNHRVCSSKRGLRLEFLEERALLSAVALSDVEYADIRACYAGFELSENRDDVNVITLDLAEGDGLADLKDAISEAGATTKSDLIVVRTSEAACSIALDDAPLIFDVNSDLFGSLTLVGYGDFMLTVAGTSENVAVVCSGEVRFGGVSFLALESEGASFMTENLVVVSEGAEADFARSMFTIEGTTDVACGTTLSVEDIAEAGAEDEPLQTTMLATHTYKVNVNISGTKWAFMNGVSEEDYDLLRSWTYSGTITSNFIDAEKDGDGDRQLCWAGAAANILWYTGWANSSQTDSYGNYFQNEDDVFDYFVDHFTNDGGSPSYGFKWFLSGQYDMTGVTDWSQLKKDGGGFYPDVIPSEICGYQSAVSMNRASTIIKRIQMDYGIALSLGKYVDGSTRKSGHAVTAWGYVYDMSFSTSDASYYVGLLITDSDNNKFGGRDAKNTLTCVNITWDSSMKMFHLTNYSSGYYYLDGYSYLAPYIEENTPLFTPRLNVPTVSGTTVTVTWGNVAYASTYCCEYKLSTDSAWQTASVSGTSATFSGIQDANYVIRVMAITGNTRYLNSDYAYTTVRITDIAPGTYNTHDLACLQAFLEQTDAAGVKNGTKINASYGINDPTTWTGVTWEDSASGKVVTSINWQSKKLAGELDLRGYASLKTLNVTGNSLLSLNCTGCTVLEILNCGTNQITSLKINGCTNLQSMTCSKNSLTVLDLTENTKLNTLRCSKNRITSLNFTANNVLEKIECYDNKFVTLDLSFATSLRTLYFGNEGAVSLVLPLVAIQNQLKLYLWHYLNLDWIIQNQNGEVLDRTYLIVPGLGQDEWIVTELPVTAICEDGSASLEIEISQTVLPLNPPENLQVTQQTSSSVSLCWDPVANASGYTLIYSTSQDFSDASTKTGITGNSVTIEHLSSGMTWYFRVKAVSGGQYSSSGYSSVLAVTIPQPPTYNAHDVACLRAFLEQTEAGVKNGTKINAAYDANDPTTWKGTTWTEVENSLRLSNISWFSNGLVGTLDLSGCTTLTKLEVCSNRLDEVKLVGCTALTIIDIYSNRLESLDVTGCTELKTLICTKNSLTHLDVTGNLKLTALDCYDNQLSELDVSRNTALEELWCGYNQLTSIDLSGCKDLFRFECRKNPIPLLDLSACELLESLEIWNSELSTVLLSSKFPGSGNLSLTESGTAWTITDSQGSREERNTYFFTPTELPFIAVNEEKTQTIVFRENLPQEPLPTPGGVEVTASDRTVSVCWDSVPDAASYRVEYKSVSEENWTTLSVSGTSASFVGEEGMIYEVRVMALAGVGYNSDSAYSETRFVQIPIRLTRLTLSSTTLRAGDFITAEVEPNDASVLFWWFRGNTLISGVTGGSYQTSVADVGYSITCVAQGYNLFTGTVSASTDKVGKPSLNAPIEPDYRIEGKNVSLTWDAVTNADSYTVEYRTVGASKWSVKNGLKTTNYQISPRSGCVYEVRVTAIAGKNSSYGDSAPANITVDCTQMLSTLKLKATSQLDDSATVALTGLSGQATYLLVKLGNTTVQVSTFGESVALGSVRCAVQNGSLVLTGLQSSTKYALKVQQAIVEAGVTRVCSTGASVKIQTTKTCYETPENVAAYVVSDTQVTVSWSSVFGKKSNQKAGIYTVQYSVAGSGKWSNATTKAVGTSFTVAKLKGGTSYEFRVFATKDKMFMASGFSASAQAVTYPTAPKIASVASKKSGCALLTWNYSTDVQKYEIRYRVKDSTDWQTVTIYAGGGTKMLYTLKGLTTGRAYEFQIRSLNARLDASSWSATKVLKKVI